jgi:dynein heavy chain, axonemal
MVQEAQTKCCVQLADRLQCDWRRAFSEQLVDSIQDVYDFFQSDARLYRSSGIHT